MSKNSYVARLEAAQTEAMQIAERVTRQFDIDTMCIALNRKAGFGYRRIMEILGEQEAVRAEFCGAITKGEFSDVHRDHLDRELLQIARDPALITPFEQRYPELKKIDYRGRGERR